MIRTQRLILRPWKEEDLEPFAQLNADPRVMEFFPSILNREESDRFAGTCKGLVEKNGWGPWAVSVINGADFIGYIGLKSVDWQAHFTPAVEVGWRLAYEFWGKGYATEGAKAALSYGFETLLLKEIVSITYVCNMRSRKVMEKIGMKTSSKDDFEFPKLPEGHRLRSHVLYRLQKDEWQKSRIV